MQIVCKLTLTMRDKPCLNAIFVMAVLGLRVPCPTRSPPRHTPNLEHPQGVENLGALMANKTSWAQAYIPNALPLQHPPLPRGSGVVLPHQHHRGSVQKGAALTQATGKPTAATQWEKLRTWPLSRAAMALLPKRRMESCLGGPCRTAPHVLSLWRWQVALAKPQPARQSYRSQGQRFLGHHGIANTHGLGHVLWTERIRLPATRTWCQIPLPLMLFRY